MNIGIIPTSFILEKVPLTWPEALWGYEHALLGWRSIVQIAENRLSNGSDDPMENELASLTKDYTWKVGELLRELSNKCMDVNHNHTTKKWLYLVLAWIYFNRSDFEDPLRMVEVVFAEFDYPKEIKQFVGFMPATSEYDPCVRTLEENEARLYQLWSEYLDDSQKSLSDG